MNAPARELAVIGDGLEGAIVAATLARSLRGTGFVVAAYAAGRAHAPPPAVECPPSLRALHDLLSLSEPDIMRACDGAYSVGAIFEDDTGATRGVVPYGALPPAWRGAPFRQHWIAAARRGEVARFHEFSPAALAALAGRLPFAHDDPGRFLAEVGFCLDTNLYTRFMRDCAAHYGAHMSDRIVRGTEVVADNARLVFDDGTSDVLLAIDCSGAALASAVSAERVHPAIPRPAVAIRRRSDGGYAIDRPLRGSTVSIAVTPQVFSVERRVAEPWRGPLVRIGGAFAASDPIAGPELRLVAAGVNRLLPLIAGDVAGEQERAEYNRVMFDLARRLRDAQSIMRHAACGAPLDAGPELARRIEQFVSRGRVVTYDYDSFNEDEWTSAFFAAGLAPIRAHVLAETIDAGERARFLDDAAQKAKAQAGRAPPAGEALMRLVGASKVQPV